MISGHVTRQRLGLILSMSVALGISSNSYGAVSFQGLPLNMVAAPTAVEDVNPELLTGIKAPQVNGDGSVKKAGDGSVRSLGDGSVMKMDGSVKTGELVPAVHAGDAKHHATGDTGKADPPSELGHDAKTGELLPAVHVGDKQQSGGGGGAGKGKGGEASAQVDFFTPADSHGYQSGGHGKGGEASAQVDFFTPGDSQGYQSGGHGKGGESSAQVDYKGGGGPVSVQDDKGRKAGDEHGLIGLLRDQKGGDAAHGAGGGGGAGKGKGGEASAQVDFFTPSNGAAQVDRKAGGSQHGLNFGGTAVTDIPIDQGSENPGKNFTGKTDDWEPRQAGNPNATLTKGQGSLVPAVQGNLDLPFSEAAGGKGGFTGGVDISTHGGAYQPQGNALTGKGGESSSLNFTRGAVPFTTQQGAVNGVGKAGGFVPFNPGALGNFATPTPGGAVGAAGSIGVVGGAAAGGARLAPTGIGGTISGAGAKGHSVTPAFTPGALIIPTK